MIELTIYSLRAFSDAAALTLAAFTITCASCFYLKKERVQKIRGK